MLNSHPWAKEVAAIALGVLIAGFVLAAVTGMAGKGTA